jgi:membrane protease YdiL (CAAX protease family)
VDVRTALAVTGGALVASFGVGRVADRLPVGEIDFALRAELVATVAFYVLLGALLTWFVLGRRVQLVWSRAGGPLASVALGLPVGLVLGGLGVALNSLGHGRLAGDPSIEMSVGGGGVLRFGLSLIVASVLAPLVEETLFRGICAGSLLAKGPTPAVLVSAFAFAVWHMRLDALSYYSLMGVLFAALWLKRGLVASIAAHAAFNGVLVFAAIASTTGAGHMRTYVDLTFLVPGGWHEAPPMGPGLQFFGPAATELDIAQVPWSGTPSTDEVLAELSRRTLLGFPVGLVQREAPTVVTAASGEAVTARIEVSGQPGHVLGIGGDHSLFLAVMVTGGSPAAEDDWTDFVRTVRTSQYG